MKTNNKKYKYGLVFTLYLLGWALFSPVSAQDYDGRINVKPKLSLIGDSLYIDIMVKLEGVPIESERSLTLTPVLTRESRTKHLTPIIINGPHRHQLYLRYRTLNAKKMKESDYPVAMKRGDRSFYTKEIAYSTSVRYEPWMGEASLDLVQDLCGCAGYTQKISVERLVAMIIPPEVKVQPQLAYITPEVEAEKMRDEQADVFLDFKVSETVILPDFMSNRSELNKAEKLLRELQDDKIVTITSIIIKGFASPEGKEDVNQRLSVGRASALNQYLSQRFVIPRNLYRVEPVGEDWEGFERLMEETSLFDEIYRNDVLGIIRSNVSNDDKHMAVVALKTGSYEMILKNIYSKLRRVTCLVDYKVRAFNLEEAKELIFTKPQQLSLEEMFRVANTFDVANPQFGEIFETAVRLFPEDKTANLNAAATSMIHGDVVRAKRYLDRSDQNTLEYMNNRGVYELLNENYDEARVWLEKAKKNGSKQAEHNLAELEKKLATLYFKQELQSDKK
jgi:outer membrane protein OmpA-like peptidoglycan-associated protein